MEPENIHSTVMIANCYLDLKDYDQALKYYFRAEYRDPGNLKILRPIAYCYFALGKFDDSEKYYERLSSGKLTAHDYINIGHLSFVRGDKKESVEHYRKSIMTGEVTKEQFISIFVEDQPLLISLAQIPDDIANILDYLLFSFD